MIMKLAISMRCSCSRLTTSRSQLLDVSKYSAIDDAVAKPVCSHAQQPNNQQKFADRRLRISTTMMMKQTRSPHAASQHPAVACCRTAASRAQSMMMMKPASSPGSATRHWQPTETCSRMIASRVQALMMMTQTSSLHAASHHPSEAGCRMRKTTASRVKH
jgi:hypothetical protein